MFLCSANNSVYLQIVCINYLIGERINASFDKLTLKRLQEIHNMKASKPSMVLHHEPADKLYVDFANHYYGTTVLPARAYKPND